MGKGGRGGRRGSSSGVSSRIDATKPEYISGLPTRKQVGVLYAAIKNDKMRLSDDTVSKLYEAADTRNNLDVLADKVNGSRSSADYMDEARKIDYDYEMGSRAITLAQQGDYEAAAVAATRAVNGGSHTHDSSVIKANKNIRPSTQKPSNRSRKITRSDIEAIRSGRAPSRTTTGNFAAGSSAMTKAFGKVTVLSQAGDVVTVRTSDGSTKKLMANFLSK